MSDTSGIRVTGGCQCGAVRYTLHMEPERNHYCHCRMCQRAVGNLFAALAGCRKEKLEWTGTPDFFASSTVARRGFCKRCGTPLSFDYAESDWIYLTIGSLDEPARAEPGIHFGVESQVPWLHIDDAHERKKTLDDQRLKDMTVFQFQGLSHG